MYFPFHSKIVVRPRREKVGHLIKSVVLIISVGRIASRHNEAQPIQEPCNFDRGPRPRAFDIWPDVIANPICYPFQKIPSTHQPLTPPKGVKQFLYLWTLVLMLCDQICDSFHAILRPNLVNVFFRDCFKIQKAMAFVGICSGGSQKKRKKTQ
jgi:hypothetical protein